MKNMLATLTHYKALKAKEAELKTEIETLKNTITEYMKENGSNKLTCGQYIATITEVTKTTIDEKALRENLPDVAKQFEKSTTYDRFTVK